MHSVANEMSKKERLTREEEERIWTISAAPYIVVMVGAIVYLIHLKFTLGVLSDYALTIYAMGVVVPSYGAMVAGTFEVISSFKVEKPLSLRIKRFLGRTISAFAFAWLFLLIYNVYRFLLLPFSSDDYILVLAGFSTALAIAAMTSHSKTGSLIRRLTGEGIDRE